MKLLYNSSVIMGMMLAGLLLLGNACDQDDADEAGQAVERAVDKTGNAIQNGADDAGEVVKDGAEAAGKAKQEMGEVLELAGEKMQDTDDKMRSTKTTTGPATLPAR